MSISRQKTKAVDGRLIDELWAATATHSAPADRVSVLVIDEVPSLTDVDGAFEEMLQRAAGCWKPSRCCWSSSARMSMMEAPLTLRMPTVVRGGPS
ncbi:hypothetical protein ACFV4E_14665 [Streptomyces hygroscopicus]|uniref:hypothetical protein n=1 Tax=Streptomyces hygroscopicus TaxID=1912 RepID=UPI00207BCABB